jgi:MFS family permease
MHSTVSTPSFQKLRNRYRNRVRIATALFFFGMGFSFATWASRIPSIKSQLHLSEADLGSLLLALPIGQLLAMTFSGKLVTHYGSRWICMLGLLFYAGCLPFISLSHTKWELAIALTCFGFFGNLCNIAVNTQGVYTQSFFEKPIMGSFHGSWSLAGFAGALTGLVMLSFQMSVFHHFCIALALVTLLVITNTKYLVKTKASKPEEKSSYNFIKNPDKTLLWLGIICFCGMASEGIMFDWSGVYFKEIVQAPGALVILGYTTFMISMAAGRFLSDVFVARLGNRKVLLFSGLIISLGLYTAVLFPYLIPSTVAFMLVGIGVSNVIPIIFNAAGNHPTIPTGIALTVVTSISFLGFLIGPPIIGYIAELTSLRYSFAVIGVFGLIIARLVNTLNIFK